MAKFLDILSNLYLLVYTYAYFALLDWLDPKGNFERIFKRPMQFWHCVVIFILWALVAAILPNLVNCIIGVALLFLWIGYKLSNNSSSSNASAPISPPVSKDPLQPPPPPRGIAPPPVECPPPRPGRTLSIRRVDALTISHWGYHAGLWQLHVRLRKSGEILVYCDVPFDVSEEFRISSSIDLYYKNVIEGRYRFYSRGYHEPKGPFEW